MYLASARHKILDIRVFGVVFQFLYSIRVFLPRWIEEPERYGVDKTLIHVEHRDGRC